MSFIVLQKTKHSQLCLDTFKIGKGLNIAYNDWFIAKQLIEQSHDEEEQKKADYNLRKLIAFLKTNKLKIVCFAFGFDKERNTYIFSYTVRSKIHNNPDFKVDGAFPSLDIGFVMFPQMFATSLNEVLEKVPFDQLLEVAQGR